MCNLYKREERSLKKITEVINSVKMVNMTYKIISWLLQREKMILGRERV